MDGPGDLLEDHEPADEDVRSPVPEDGSVEGTLDRKMAADVYRKVLGGQELTLREQTVLKRFEKEKEERLRWLYYSSIRQKHWVQMSGRQAKILIEQQERYGLPLGGRCVDLPKLARALHDFLADNAHKLAKEPDELLQGAGSPALERYREERAAIARLDRLEREGQLLPRDLVRESLGRIAAILRSAGDTLQRQFGSAAAEILLEGLDDAHQEINRSFAAEEVVDHHLEPVTSSD